MVYYIHRIFCSTCSLSIDNIYRERKIMNISDKWARRIKCVCDVLWFRLLAYGLLIGTMSAPMVVTCGQVARTKESILLLLYGYLLFVFSLFVLSDVLTRIGSHMYKYIVWTPEEIEQHEIDNSPFSV